MKFPRLPLRKPSLPLYADIETVRDVNIRAFWNGEPTTPLEVEILYQFNAPAGMYENLFEHNHPSVCGWEIQYIDGYVHRYIQSDSSKYSSSMDSGIGSSPFDSPILAPSPSPSSQADLPWASMDIQFDDDFEPAPTQTICKDIEANEDFLIIHNSSDKFHHIRMLIKAQILLEKAHSGRGYTLIIPGLAEFYDDKLASGFFGLSFTDGKGDAEDAAWKRWYYIGDQYDVEPFTSAEQCCSFSPYERFSLRLVQPHDLPILDETSDIEESHQQESDTQSESGSVIHHICRDDDSDKETVPELPATGFWTKIHEYTTLLFEHIPTAINCRSNTAAWTAWLPSFGSIIHHVKIILLFWLLLRAFFHDSTVQFEKNLFREASEVSKLITTNNPPQSPPLPIFTSEPLPEAATEFALAPDIEGPQNLVDYFDYMLGYKGPNGDW